MLTYADVCDTQVASDQAAVNKELMEAFAMDPQASLIPSLIPSLNTKIAP